MGVGDSGDCEMIRKLLSHPPWDSMKTKTKVNVVMFGNEGEREREQSGTFFFSSLAIRDTLFMQLR